MARQDGFCRFHEVRIGADTILHPDAFVICHATDRRTEQAFTAPAPAPALLGDVLSPLTQSHDRGSKVTLYLSLPSLRQSVLLDPDPQHMHLFRRGAGGLFTLHDLTGREHVTLTSVDREPLASEGFDGVEPAPGQPSVRPV